MHEVMDRKTAQDLGLKFYYPGTECKHGHLSQYYTSSGNCLSCTQDKAAFTKEPTQFKDQMPASNIRQRAADYELARELAQIEREHQI